MRVLVAGAAGFLGSHLTDALLEQGHDVLGVDNLCTGSLENLKGKKIGTVVGMYDIPAAYVTIDAVLWRGGVIRAARQGSSDARNRVSRSPFGIIVCCIVSGPHRTRSRGRPPGRKPRAPHLRDPALPPGCRSPAGARSAAAPRRAG